MRYLYFRGNTSQARPSRHHLLAYFDACASRAHLVELHGQLVRAHLASDSFVASRLIAFLASPAARHDMHYARKVFDRMAQPSVFVWNCMIRGYNSCGAPADALALFRAMRWRGVSPDNYTMAALVSVSAAFAGSTSWRSTGNAVHALVRRIGFTSDVFVMSGLVNFYGALRSVEEASKVFKEMYERDVVSWTSMISALARCGQWDKVLRFLSEMQAEGINPNKVTIISVLSACAQTQAVDKGRWVYNQVGRYGIEADVDIRNALISMYAKCGCLSDALEAFQDIPARYTKSWNTLIDGFVQNHEHKEALIFFEEMMLHGVAPDSITLVSVLSACAQLGDLQKGRHVHSYIQDNGICCDNILTNSLINMYAKCGDMTAAEKIFQTMKKKDAVSWTVMVCGYVKGQQFRLAFNLFEEMKIAEVVAHMALVSLLSACSQLGALDKGRDIHSYIEEKNVAKDLCLESALLDMYAKCGCIGTAAEIFRKMEHKQTLLWNLIIGGLASNGHGEEAVELFDQMLKLRDPKPDGITLKAVLGACAHVGMVDEGLHYFYLMSSLGISPDVEHYGCIVDLLGRAGLLDEAFHFNKKMPIEPNSVIWGSLLAACRVHHRMDLGKVIGQHIVNLAPNDVGAHVLVSNLHADKSQWDDVELVRGLMGTRGIQKAPGHSSIQVEPS
uniref:Pentacotripeptide-repeat region of PRORP domain-containing protein n=1 Tax=Oryza brachyantha TaxID=4533 RepID=J3L2B6_ORYBR